VKIDTSVPTDLEKAQTRAADAEQRGYDGMWTGETNHDPFFPLVLAASATNHIQLGTSIAIAFARTPMTMATLGWDLNAYSRGRCILGLGSQIKPHIEKRFSMPWSHPAARMREFVLAMRAIWDTWQHGVPLDFRGDYYTHTLMTPVFSPRPNDYGAPRVMLAGVGERMIAAAGETADGLIVHPFCTERYLRETIMPTIEAGLTASGRTREDFELALPLIVVTGATEEAMAHAAVGARERIAFYGSTPAYRGVFEAHGWGDLQPELNRLSKQGEWKTMGTLIDDEVLETFTLVAEPDRLAHGILERFGGLLDRVTLNVGYTGGWKPPIELLRAVQAGA
jgi:probable F420-dependent oxidoreductase